VAKDLREALVNHQQFLMAVVAAAQVQLGQMVQTQ
jgi:hypothetical protein